MLPRTVSLARAARIASRFQPVRCGSDVALHGPSPRELAEQQLATFDHITVPQGSWQVDYQKRQARYNRNIIINAVIMFALSYWVYASGAVKMYGAPSLEGIDPFAEDENVE